MIENPADELRLRRIINTPARKIGDKSVETAMQLAVEYGTTLYDVVCHASQYPALSLSLIHISEGSVQRWQTECSE